MAAEYEEHVWEAAELMALIIDEDGTLTQKRAVGELRTRDADELIYRNRNGHPAISKGVLAAFRELTDDSVIWERGKRRWRRRSPSDPEGRQQR